MKRIVLAGLFVFASLLAAEAQQAGRISVPIIIGGTDSMDNACDEGGNIFGLDPQGDGFLSVRSGPGGQPYYEVDRLYNGMHVKICDDRGRWLGVVYSPTGEHDGCNVEHEWRMRLPYTGPCRYGWVASRYVGDRAN